MPVAVLGATGAIGGRFVEIVAGEGRAPIRALVHRWWHTGRIARFPIELRSVPALGSDTPAADLAAALGGCGVVISTVDATGLDAAAASPLVASCVQAGVRRLVHLGCLHRWSDPGFDHALIEAGRAAGLEVVVVAAPLVYGPFTQAGAHEPLQLVQRGRVAIAEDRPPCDLIYVDDLVEALWAAAVREGPLAGLLLATGPEPVAWADLYDAFGAIVDRPGAAVLPAAEVADLRRLAASDPAAFDALRWPPAEDRGRRLARKVRRRVGMGVDERTPRRRLVLPEPGSLTDPAAAGAPPHIPSATSIGWSPAVDLAEGMRRTAAYLEWIVPS